MLSSRLKHIESILALDLTRRDLLHYELVALELLACQVDRAQTGHACMHMAHTTQATRRSRAVHQLLVEIHAGRDLFTLLCLLLGLDGRDLLQRQLVRQLCDVLGDGSLRLIEFLLKAIDDLLFERVALSKS